MNTESMKVDALGFSEAVKSISQEVRAQVSEVADRIRRGRAVLGALQAKLAASESNEGLSAGEQTEVADLVDVVAMLLPKHYEDVDDPIEALGWKIRREAERGAWELKLAREALEAMTAAARSESTIAELEAHAKRLFENAGIDLRYGETWKAFERMLQGRGLVARQVLTESGLCIGVEVLTPDMVKVKRKIDRSIRSLRHDGMKLEAMKEANRDAA